MAASLDRFTLGSIALFAALTAPFAGNAVACAQHPAGHPAPTEQSASKAAPAEKPADAKDSKPR